MHHDHFDIVKPEPTTKELAPNLKAHKSNWALLLIVLACILCALFFFTQSNKTQPETTPVTSQLSEKPATTPTPAVDTSSLEASVSAIIIPDYSDLF